MRILVGDAYVSDGLFQPTVITTEKHQPVDRELISIMYKNIRETDTKTNYQPEDLFLD
jgi:hypothetical protein